MKGILNTTLTFFAQNTQKKVVRWRVSNMHAFYLTGQGAVFEIPTSGLRSGGNPSFDFDFEFDPELEEQMAEMSEEIRESSLELAKEAQKLALERAKEARWESDSEKGKSSLTAPAPPAPPTPPAPPVPEANRAKLKKAVEDAQARAKKMREEAEATREKFLKNLGEAKGYLIEALANYGDGMTTVKPEEYINLVLTTDNNDDQRIRADVVSVRKSWISDYKAGRLTMEAFKQKVIQYNQ
jgi:hypothetical protein